ncbi:MAG: recombination mediator RecR [Actinomycetota bacterium]|nr:recombination mediator RecR [Actinomycetota bacterium]
MSYYPKPLENLINELVKLPSIGAKTAQRLALHILSQPDDAKSLAAALLEARQNVKLCRICFNFSGADICDICADKSRRRDIYCVVEEAKDIIAIERTGFFQGLYHVLGGAIAPMEGVGPEKLKIPELLERLKKAPVDEVILATNPNLEGEATAMYLAKLLKPMGIKVTRIASGLPVGGDLEYADEITLGRALEGRRDL